MSDKVALKRESAEYLAELLRLRSVRLGDVLPDVEKEIRDELLSAAETPSLGEALRSISGGGEIRASDLDEGSES